MSILDDYGKSTAVPSSGWKTSPKRAQTNRQNPISPERLDDLIDMLHYLENWTNAATREHLAAARSAVENIKKELAP